eukprot:m.31430 g.31430  ORF g.31430 m.31430 type:complete len:91 (-) comp12070_c0_seq1:187-459(-)
MDGAAMDAATTMRRLYVKSNKTAVHLPSQELFAGLRYYGSYNPSGMRRSLCQFFDGFDEPRINQTGVSVVFSSATRPALLKWQHQSVEKP